MADDPKQNEANADPAKALSEEEKKKQEEALKKKQEEDAANAEKAKKLAAVLTALAEKDGKLGCYDFKGVGHRGHQSRRLV